MLSMRRSPGLTGAAGGAGCPGFAGCGTGVTVNSILPGFHDTERVRGVNPDPAAIAAQIEAGTMGRPVDFGQVAAFLCSDPARFVTGAALQVDGGVYAGLL